MTRVTSRQLDLSDLAGDVHGATPDQLALDEGDTWVAVVDGETCFGRVLTADDVTDLLKQSGATIFDVHQEIVRLEVQKACGYRLCAAYSQRQPFGEVVQIHVTEVRRIGHELFAAAMRSGWTLPADV